METAPCLDAFKDQEIGRAGRDLDIRGPNDWSAIKMRRDLHMIDLGHCGNLSWLPICRQRVPRFICRIAAAPARSSRAKSYLVVSRSPVATGIDVARATLAISSGASGGYGFFQPQRVIWLKPSWQAGSRLPPSFDHVSRTIADPLSCQLLRVAGLAQNARTDPAPPSDSCRPSNAEYGPAGSNFSAVKPWSRYSAARVCREIGVVINIALCRRAAGRYRCRRATVRAPDRRAIYTPACWLPCR